MSLENDIKRKEKELAKIREEKMKLLDNEIAEIKRKELLPLQNKLAALNEERAELARKTSPFSVAMQNYPKMKKQAEEIAVEATKP